MSTCPEIPIFEEDPFIFYARYLIESFRDLYGTDRLTYNGQTVFQYSVDRYDSIDDAFGQSMSGLPSIPTNSPNYYLGDLSTAQESVINSAVDWPSSLPLYIKGPRWNGLSSYSTSPWDIHDEDNQEGWFDLAGGLVVHPMLSLAYDRYHVAFRGDNTNEQDLPWHNWFSGQRQIRDAFSNLVETPVGVFPPISIPDYQKTLKFGFLLEVLAAFIHIHDESGGTVLTPDMEEFTWCQMFWSGYEPYQGDETRSYLGEGTEGLVAGDAWAGELNPPGSDTRIIYVPRKDQSYSFTFQAGSPPSDYTITERPQNEGPVHATSIIEIGANDGTNAIQGHSVKIENADYRAFLFWLQKALKLLDSDSLGPIETGPARQGLSGDDFLSQIFIQGAAPSLSSEQSQITGPPYGGLVSADPYVNNSNIKIFRAMADRLYFDDNSGLPLADVLPTGELDYWNSFLQQHSVSVSLSTEALNEAILLRGVEGGECEAINLDSELPTLEPGNANPGQCRDLDEGPLTVETYQSCIPNPDAIVPNWLNQSEDEPFLNQKTCEYSIVMLADPPDCSEEYFNTFIPDAINKLLDYYNKEVNADFTNVSTGFQSVLSSRDALTNGSEGLYLDGLAFVGTAKVKTFYIPPRPKAKTKVLITVSAEEFNRIPERQPKVEEGTPTPVYSSGERSFVVFKALEMEDIFDKVSYAFGLYDRFYAQWHLDTGKIIRGLNFSTESKRIESFFKETDLLLRESGHDIRGLEWVEIGFTPEFTVEYIKIQKQNSSPIQIEKGFSSFVNRAPMNDKTTCAYVSQLPNMKNDLMIREAISWYDMLSKYRFPAIQENYGLDNSSPITEGNESIKQLEQEVCASGLSSGIFEPNLFGNSTQKQKWAESQINDIKGALLSQFSSNPCALVDAKILEHQGRTDFALQITDMTLKEYLTSDRFINDLPELLVRGRYKELGDLYGGMLNNLGMCGLIDLIKAAVDCILNALGYDDAISIIVGAAVKGMDDEFVGKFINSLPPEAQEVIVASVNEVAPQLLPFLAGFATVTILDDGGAVIEPVYDRQNSYTSKDIPLGSLGDQGFVGVTRTPGTVTTELTLSDPPAQVGSLGREQRAATPQDYGQLKDVIYDLVVNDLLNLDEILNVLNNLPGAGIAVNILQKIDKFCIAPPLFYPPLKEFIKLPGVNLDFCELQASITIPVIPKIKFNTISKILIDNALRVLEELLIRLLILVLKKILEIIAEELCKTRRGQDPLNLRDALKANLCGNADIDPELVDGALTDLLANRGCYTDAVAMGRLVDNVASVVTQCELVDLINGEGSDNLYDLIVEIVRTDPVTASLTECLFDRDSVHEFFKAIGIFVDLDQLCIQSPTNLPVSREVCDNMGLLNVFRATRAEALRAKGVDEACIEGQLCVLRDQTAADLEDLMSLLQAGIFNSVIPDIMKDPTSDKPGLLPSEMPMETIALDNIYNSIFDAMSLSFTEDIIGKRGFLNMVLADSRGRGYRQHLGFQSSVLGPSVLNIYGSRGTRAYPPRDEWGQGANTPKDHNNWVTGPREFTEGNLWRLPFLFNPLSSTGDGETEGNTGNNSNGDPISGKAPALGGLPDKVAGHLQDSLINLSTPFNVESGYTTNLFWFDYDNPDTMQFTFSFDYWTTPPDGQQHSWDGHRLRINMKNENWEDEGGDPYEEVISYFDIKSSVDDVITSFKSNILSDYYIGGSSSPDSTFQALVEHSVYEYLGQPDTPRGDAAGSFQFDVEYDSAEDSMVIGFEKISQRILEALAELVAAEGSDNSPFVYGFDATKPPIIKYFHEEEFDGDIGAAVERYGGSEGNPPFYLKQPDNKGYLRIAQKIIPEFNPCEDSSDVVTFPDFSSLKSVCSEFSAKVPMDERAGLKVKGVSAERELPFDRHLSKASLGIIEGTIYATIRTYVVEVLMKGLPVLQYLALSEFNYGEMLSEFVIDKMEQGMKDAGRGKRFVEKYEDYWWLFLEQVVQNFGIKVNLGLITDITPEEQEALDFINQFVEDNWVYVPPGLITGLNSARRLAKRRKQNWDTIFQSTVGVNAATGLPETVESPIISRCKTILRRYIRNEYARTTEIFSESVSPNFKDVNDIILKSPTIIRGAIGTSEAGPYDVPNAAYFESSVAGVSVTHPYDSPDILISNSNTPFVLERYLVSKGSTDTANTFKLFGLVSNIFDAQVAHTGEVLAEDEVYFGLRISFIPSAARISNLTSDMSRALAGVSEGTGYSYKAFNSLYKNAIPIASAEIQLTTDAYEAGLYNDYLQRLVCLLIETPAYKTLFEHCYPIPKYMDLLALYCANTFVPSLARVEDGWAATANNKKRGGGRWIGAGKNGGMHTWRGNEGMKNSFKNTKLVARQTLEAACYTSYDYRDKDYMSPSEVYVDNLGSNSDLNPGIKWWQWSSLRPAPCKNGDD